MMSRRTDAGVGYRFWSEISRFGCRLLRGVRIVFLVNQNGYMFGRRENRVKGSGGSSSRFNAWCFSPCPEDQLTAKIRRVVH